MAAQAQSQDSRSARYAFALWALLGVFIFRVAAQGLLALGYGSSFFPPWEEWFSGLVPYPRLLISQFAIIAVFAKVGIDFSRGSGISVRPRRAVGTALTFLGSLYLTVMVIRYLIRMALYPPERWIGGSIPIVFHWVLAAFILVVGRYHRRESPRLPHRRRLRTRLMPLAIWLLAAAGVSTWIAYQLAPTILAVMLHARRADHAVRIDRGVAMTTSDGVRLVADVYRPLRETRTPTLLVRIPFSKTLTNSLFATVVGRFWAERGYTVVIQGTRGRYESEGRHTPLVDERRDGIDTIDWLRRQPFFDGRVGMWGGSAFGYTQWAIADRLPFPPAGRAALMIQICSTDFHGMFYPGGAFSLATALFWTARSHGATDVWPDPTALARGFDGLPLIEADNRAVGDVGFFNDWVTHQTRDAYWQAIDGDDRAAALRAPVLLMAGWFDPFLPGQLADFQRIKRDGSAPAANATRLVIGPWAHAETVVLPGAVQTRNYRLESLAPTIPWFDRHLLDGKADDAIVAPVRIYVMGANAWRDEREWPLARARQTIWYLHSGGHANTAAGDGTLSTDAPIAADATDTFRADPLRPVPTRGGAMLGDGAGPVRQNDVEARADVLVYSTAPLTADLEVTGPISMTLYVATSAPSTDFTAKLVDVHPDGAAYNLSDGILRRSYRPSAAPSLGDPTEVVISLWPTSNVFRQGHRIRLEISSTNFPRFDRNPNTGEPSATATATAVADQAVFHGPRSPSRLVLPVVDSAGRDALDRSH